MKLCTLHTVGLALVLLSAPLARAQEADPQATTNQVMAAEDQSAAADAADAADAGSTPVPDTNSVAAEPDVTRTTATPEPSGRESRARRFRNRRSDLAGGATNYGSEANALATNGGPGSLEYPAFQLIARRNIFDPNRRPNMVRQQRDTSRPPRVDSISLVGTMTYEKGTFAFFNGSSSQYQKAIKPDGEIAGYKLAAVMANSVKLAQGTNELELRVGHQLRREEDGPWVVSTNVTAYGAASRSSRGSFGGASPAPSAVPLPSGPQGDILKRMMQRREQE